MPSSECVEMVGIAQPGSIGDAVQQAILSMKREKSENRIIYQQEEEGQSLQLTCNNLFQIWFN
jgi:hypothetical protein